jgi:hypothetical protein
MLERGAILGRFQPPAFDAAFFAGALRWLIAILILAGAIRVALRMSRRRSAESKEQLEGQLDSSRGL